MASAAPPAHAHPALRVSHLVPILIPSAVLNAIETACKARDYTVHVPAAPPLSTAIARPSCCSCIFYHPFDSVFVSACGVRVCVRASLVPAAKGAPSARYPSPFCEDSHVI